MRLKISALMLFLMTLLVNASYCQMIVSPVIIDTTGRPRPPFGTYAEFTKNNESVRKVSYPYFLFHSIHQKKDYKIGFIDRDKNGKPFDMGSDYISIIEASDSLFDFMVDCPNVSILDPIMSVQLETSFYRIDFSALENSLTIAFEVIGPTKQVDIKSCSFIDLEYNFDLITKDGEKHTTSLESEIHKCKKLDYFYLLVWNSKYGPDLIPGLNELKASNVGLINLFSTMRGNISYDNIKELKMPGVHGIVNQKLIEELGVFSFPYGALVTREGSIIKKKVMPSEALKLIIKN